MKKGWVTKTLGDVCDVVGGGTPPKDKPAFYSGDIPWATVRDMRQDVITETEFRITKDAVKSSATNIVPSGNVVIATRVGLGKVCLIGQDTAINQDLRGIVPRNDKALIVRYLYWWLKGIADVIVAAGTGATVQGVKLPFVKSLQIPVPPLAEQKRIVGLLDEAFEAIATAKANTEQNLQNARAIFESYLNEVFTKKGKGWVETRLGDVCHKITDGTHHSPQIQFSERGPDTFPYITSKNIRNNFINLSKVAYVEQAFHDEVYARCKPSLGDVLLTKDGANTGNVTLNTIDEPFSLLSSVCLIKTNKELLKPAFLCFYLQSSAGSSAILGQMTGAAIKRIVLKDIKKAVISFPPLKEQETFVATLNSLLEVTQRLVRLYEQKLDALEELKKSLLNKAFAGEL
jgi:type I restriction enzyme S subunit